MRACTVTMPGQYGQPLSSTVTAESLFDAADQFIGHWCQLSDWQPNGVMTVRSGGKGMARARAVASTVGMAVPQAWLAVAQGD
jgi:hypothetical protein